MIAMQSTYILQSGRLSQLTSHQPPEIIMTKYNIFSISYKTKMLSMNSLKLIQLSLNLMVDHYWLEWRVFVPLCSQSIFLLDRPHPSKNLCKAKGKIVFPNCFVYSIPVCLCHQFTKWIHKPRFGQRNTQVPIKRVEEFFSDIIKIY